ncbi:MAG: isochorismatase [Bryobacteraceae bacterium]
MSVNFTRRALFAALPAAAMAAASRSTEGTIHLPLRSRLEVFKGSGVWQEVNFSRDFPVPQTGVVICDMWNNHWCKGSAGRVAELARRMEPVLEQSRGAGLQIIHAPSEVMEFYKDHPARRRILAAPQVAPPASLALSDPPLPIDDKAGGCETHDKFYKAWTREIATLKIGAGDVISDKGAEVYSFLRYRGIENLLVMGVHVNMCILNRTFAIKQMTKWGIHCVLVRDLTDSMYNPEAAPHVSHPRGTELVVEHIEKYWAPSALSRDLVKALPA